MKKHQQIIRENFISQLKEFQDGQPGSIVPDPFDVFLESLSSNETRFLMAELEKKILSELEKEGDADSPEQFLIYVKKLLKEQYQKDIEYDYTASLEIRSLMDVEEIERHKPLPIIKSQPAPDVVQKRPKSDKEILPVPDKFLAEIEKFTNKTERGLYERWLLEQSKDVQSFICNQMDLKMLPLLILDENEFHLPMTFAIINLEAFIKENYKR